MSQKLILGHGPYGGGKIFNSIFDDYVSIERSFPRMKGLGAVIIWGGTDIHPSLYDAKKHPKSQAGATVSERDEFEWEILREARSQGIPSIGICRGAQMMCAFNGGTLYQDVSGHSSGDHRITTKCGKSLWTTSCHHQMMNLSNTKHELLAWSEEKLSRYYDTTDIGKVTSIPEKEPEIVYFPVTNSLAIQGHPEWCRPTSNPHDVEFLKYLDDLILEYLIK